MLLKRFTTNLRHQDWLAVFIDVFVVAVGILAGLQANDWYEERQRTEQANYHLEFLYDHLEESIIKGKEELNQNDAVLDGTARAVDMLRLEEWTEKDLDNFNILIFSAFHLWGPKQKPVALRRLTDDGKIDLIKERDLQSAILKYEEDYIEAIEQTKTAYQTSMIITLEITNRIDFARGKILNSPAELLADKKLLSAVRNKMVWQRIQLDVLSKLQNSRKELKDLLEELKTTQT